MTIQRWEIHCLRAYTPSMLAEDDGEWCKWEDVQADLEAAKAENAVLKRALELAVQEGIDLHQVVGFDSNHGIEIYETDKEVIDRYRAEAEKGN